MLFLNQSLDLKDLDFEVMEDKEPSIEEKTYDLVKHVNKRMKRLQKSLDETVKFETMDGLYRKAKAFVDFMEGRHPELV